MTIGSAAKMKRWSDDEVARLMQLYRQTIATKRYGCWITIAAQMPGRTKQQCEQKVSYQIKGRKGYYVRDRERHPFVPMSIRVPQDVLADRDRRLTLSHRSLTAAFCGDPLPGQSALDRMSRR